MGQIWRTSMPTATDFSEVQSDTEIRGYPSKVELIYTATDFSEVQSDTWILGYLSTGILDYLSTVELIYTATDFSEVQSDTWILGDLSKVELIYKFLSHSPNAPSSSVLSISNTACQPTKNLPCFALDTDTIDDSQMRWTAEQIVNYLARVKTLEDIQELLKQDQFRKIYEQMRQYLMNDEWRERFIYYIDKVVARKRLGFKQMSNMYHALGILTVWSDALTDLG
jgi:hypothetical protein